MEGDNHYHHHHEQEQVPKSDAELLAYYNIMNEELIGEVLQMIQESQELKEQYISKLEQVKESQVKLDESSSKSLKTDIGDSDQYQKDNLNSQSQSIMEKQERLRQEKKELEKQIHDLESTIKMTKDEKQELKMKIREQQKLISKLENEIKEKTSFIGILENYHKQVV